MSSSSIGFWVPLLDLGVSVCECDCFISSMFRLMFCNSRDKCSALSMKCSVPDVIGQLTFFPLTSVFSLISFITSVEPFSRIIDCLRCGMNTGGRQMLSFEVSVKFPSRKLSNFLMFSLKFELCRFVVKSILGLGSEYFSRLVLGGGG